MPAKYRVTREDLKRGAKIEGKEHPWASETRTRRIARDHLQKYGPGYYRAEDFNERVVTNINKKMGAKPIRKRRKPNNRGFVFPLY